MSRNIPKPRAEQGRIASAQPPPPNQAEDVEDSVDPACLTKPEFLSMIAQEEGEEIVSDILDELMTHVMEKCYKVYLKKQIMPFTVAWAKNTILQMARFQYLMRDEGDNVDTMSLLQEDTAPTPSVPDSWAEGCVPVIKISNQLQVVTTEAQEPDNKDPQKIQKAQSINESESSPRKPRQSRTLKVIPASHAKMDLERRPHPPETSSPNKLKPPETHHILQY